MFQEKRVKDYCAASAIGNVLQARFPAKTSFDSCAIGELSASDL